MKISLAISTQTNTLDIPNLTNLHISRHRSSKPKVVVVVGATGAGKSRLSIDLATHFPAEIINSDKMQVYEGLDITTNKITDEEQRGIPHHLLGIINPDSDFSAGNFRALASVSLKSILDRDHLPIIVGGSNSFVEALVDSTFRSKYECCFLWVDVAMPVLDSFVSRRVDKMVQMGMVDEVRDFFRHDFDYTSGIRRAIGVPELDEYFRMDSVCDEETRMRILDEAIGLIKWNTRCLARRQLEKINRLRKIRGWRMHRVDATSAFRLHGADGLAEWENKVRGTSASIVSEFLYDSEAVFGSVIRSARYSSKPVV